MPHGLFPRRHHTSPETDASANKNPFFPFLSTGNFAPPQFLHSGAAVCRCVNFFAAAKCLQSKA